MKTEWLKGNSRKYIRTGLWVLGVLMAAFLLCFAVLKWAVLRPEKLTPLVISNVNKVIDGKLSCKSIELTLFETFPHIGVALTAGLLVAQDGNTNNLSSSGGGYSLNLPIGGVLFNKSPYWEATSGTLLTCLRNGYYNANLSVTFQADGTDCWPVVTLDCSSGDFWDLANTNYFRGVGGSVVKTQTFQVSGVMGFYNGTTLGATISVPSYSASIIRVTNMLLSLEYIRTVY